MAVTKEPDMKGFLTQYYMQRIFNAMSDEQFAQYQDTIKNKDFIGNMKDWKDTWHLVTEVDGKWVKSDLPEPKDYKLPTTTATGDKEWEKLYKELRNAFRQIANGRDHLDPKDDKKTLDFLDAFYGFGQLFSPAELTGDAKIQLADEFIPFLKDNKTNLYQALKDLGIYTDTEKSFSDFIGDLGKGKHNTDNATRDMLMHIINYLHSSYYKPEIAARMGVDATTIPDFEKLAKGLENDDIDSGKLKEFKKNYQFVLNPIEREKNIYQNFAPHLKSVKSAIDTARKRVDYNNTESKDFLTEKRPDKKGPIEQVISDVKDKWADRTDKYFSLHKSRLFYSDEAKAISKAIDKAKFSPTEGLDKFVESLPTIAGKIKGNVAKQHFKWFSETLKKLHDDKQMSSIFADALKNPRKLKELAAEIAIQGIKDGKKDAEIYTAMEVLKTIQYGYATSNHLNAVLKQDLSLFSDKSLSWNKHEGMKKVMTGLDQTINFALKGTALVATTGYNIINRNIGNKFGGNVPKRAAAAFATYQQDFDAQRAEKEAQNKLQDRLDNRAKQQARQDKVDTGITRITDAKRNLAALRADEDSKKATFESYVPYKDAVDTAQNRFDENRRTLAEKQSEYYSHRQKVDELQQTIDSYNNNPGSVDYSDYISATVMIPDASAKMIAAQNAMNVASGALTNAANDMTNARNAFSGVESAYNSAKAEYDAATKAANDLNDRIEKFKSATEQIKDINKRMRKRQEDFEKWTGDNQDRFGRLMAHWDFLNSGRMRTGENVIRQTLEGILPLSQKDRQKRYDQRKSDVHKLYMQKYLQQHNLAA